MDGKKITGAFYVTPNLPTLLILLAIFFLQTVPSVVFIYLYVECLRFKFL